MILFENNLIDEEITTEFFSCDLKKCKGGCCTYPGTYGAPVLDEEVETMNEVYQASSVYLTRRTKAYIEKNGVVTGTSGNYSTVCIDGRDCVYVYYDGDVAKCAIERAYFDGKISFRKPLSCHLFPIRVSDHGEKYLFYQNLYYQKIEECESGRENGARKRTLLYKFLEVPIIRFLGEEWFRNFEKFLNETEKK